MITLLQGDCREVLSTLDAGSVQCCITSPPFYGLRRYDVEGAQIGNEPTPAAYVAALLDVFREVKRVLRDDGTMWINLGDSYTGSGKGGNPADSPWAGFPTNPAREGQAKTGKMDVPGLAEKNLIGIPWSVAFALRDDGWYLRSAITWCKGNPMPESVRDRPTSATEMVFLLAKQPRYFYDADAIREPHSDNTHHGLSMNRASAFKKQSKVGGHGNGAATIELNPAGRNRRNWWVADEPSDERAAFGLYLSHLAERLMDSGVDGAVIGDAMRQAEADNLAAYANKKDHWLVNSQPYSGAHFATWPEKLVEPMVLAGSSPKACERCGAPWERETERENAQLVAKERIRNVGGRTDGYTQLPAGGVVGGSVVTTGWRPTCRCPNEGAARSVILDPFCGSGTTMRVAERYGRDSIGIDLGYLDIASARTDGVQIDMESLL